MQDCCVAALKDIHDTIEDGQFAVALLNAAPLIVLLPELATTVFEESAAIEVLAHLTTHQALGRFVDGYEEAEEAAKSVPLFVLEAPARISVGEMLKHTYQGQEYKFWQKWVCLYRREKP